MSFTFPIVGPVPAYTNVPINANFYEPSQFFISNITLGFTTIVTTTVDMNYVIGQQVRLIIPRQSGCTELNGKIGYVLSLPASNEVEVSINSYGGNAFTSSMAKTQPQIVAIGDITSGAINSNGNMSISTLILGSFINISPA